MNKFLTIVAALLVLSPISRADNNIFSIVVGTGPTGHILQNPGSTSSLTVKHSTSTTTITGSAQEIRGTIGGLLYQRQVGMIVLGVMVQSNETYSGSIGVAF